MIKNCSLKKCILKLIFQRNISMLLSQKNAFQKRISKAHVKSPLKSAPSKNAFQNCYKLSIGNKNKNPVGLKH